MSSVTSIWFLNHYASPPDCPGGTRHHDLGRALTRLAYDVTIFASAFNHSLHRPVRLQGGQPWQVEAVEGVRFVWVPTFRHGGNGYQRLLNMLSYLSRAYWLGRRLPRLVPGIARPGIVVGCTVHPFAALAGYLLARHHRAHFVMEVRDLWPQTFVDMGVWREGQPQVWFFRRLEQFLYARAERIITLSPLTRDYLAHYSAQWAEKVVYIPNGTDVTRFEDVRAAPRPNGLPLQVMYAGSMGFKNGVDLIVEAMRIVERAEPGLLQCTLLGDGPERAQLQRAVREQRIGNVRFDGPVPRAEVPGRLATADILVLTERKVLYGSSNKLFDYMAAGCPIVSSVFAEHNSPIERARCGISVPPENAAALAEALLTVAHMPAEARLAMGERARAYVRQHNDYPVLARRLHQVFEELACGRTSGAERQETL